MDTKVRIPKWPAALLLAFLFLAGCVNETQQTIQIVSGPTMGTTYTVKWVSVHSDSNDTAELQREIDKALAEINQVMSTYIPDSELSRFNQTIPGKTLSVSPSLLEVLKLANTISTQTDGAFDVTVGPLVNLWGFGPDGRIVSAPSDQTIAKLKGQIGYQKLVLQQQSISKTSDLYVDLSAIAKGYAVDQVALLLEHKGIRNYLVEIGGELRAQGLKLNAQPWKIAIESPVAGARKVQKILIAQDTAIATSGDYRNYFEEAGVRYSHTINPATGKPITHRLASVTVLRPTCAEADALATAFTVMGEDKAYAFAIANHIDAFFISKTDVGFSERMTPGFEKRLVK